MGYSESRGFESNQYPDGLASDHRLRAFIFGELGGSSDGMFSFRSNMSIKIESREHEGMSAFKDNADARVKNCTNSAQ
jgi:hypothetical protein